jgi:hypothetical protein
MKGRALRRALMTTDVIRINSDIPAITDTTELISPEDAKQMLKRNARNRPVNWNKVEEFAAIMRRGDWKLHPQGIILDPEANILTGQTRLWAIVHAGVAIYMRVSRGSPADTAFVIDRGRPQSARDLSTRKTERKHSPTEASIVRCICVLRGQPKPSVDEIAHVIVEKDAILREVLKQCAGTKKDKALLMILGAIAETCDTVEAASSLASKSRVLADCLEQSLLPYSVQSCWGRGVSFGMAMRKAQEAVYA